MSAVKKLLDVMQMKYLVVPGPVPGAAEEFSWLSARDLMRLYGVDPSECLITTPDVAGRYPAELIRLTPRADGNYTLPTQGEEMQS